MIYKPDKVSSQSAPARGQIVTSVLEMETDDENSPGSSNFRTRDRTILGGRLYLLVHNFSNFYPGFTSFQVEGSLLCGVYTREIHIWYEDRFRIIFSMKQSLKSVSS